MKDIKRLPLIAMIFMIIVAFSNLYGLNMAGLSVLIGIVFFFINNVYEKRTLEDSGLDVKAIGINLKTSRLWLWIIAPLVMDAICIILAIVILPDYINHVLERTDVFVSIDKIIFMVFQLAFLALAEEIAWRAFFQKQLNNSLTILPAILISSVIFAFGHLSQGKFIIVIYDIFFVFINSILYGIIFSKTNNAWISAISHFIANLFSIIVLIFLL